MALPDLTTALTSQLRSLHLAIVAQLGETFGEQAVKAHSAEVTPETVKRFSQGKYAIWTVIGSADGLETSLATELRMDVRWGVFIVAQPIHEVPDPDEPNRKRAVPAVEVAETIANLVVRLANQNKWGIDGCDFCPAASLAIRNLGVGIKSTQEFVEREDLGLFVVWGTNALAMGKGILAGDEQLPALQALIGPIVDQAKDEEQPQIEVKVDLTFMSLLARARAAVRRWLFGPSWHEQAAALINAATREMLDA